MSSNFNRPNKFLNYVKNPLSLTELDGLYKYHRIEVNKVELYRDYVLSLCDLILNTYMGDDVCKDEDMLEHFMWCWSHNEKVFKEMGYDLCRKEELVTYFQSFFMEVFYYSVEKNERLENSIKNVWDFVFNCEVIKSRKDVNNFVELYSMFDESSWYKK
jgi:hypothetical protein